MGHNDGTQSPLEPMPKHPHILKRDGRYYYRKRIPSDLVQAGCYGEKKDIKHALGTSDLAKANSLAKTVALKVDTDFEAKRCELKAGNSAHSCKNTIPCIPKQKRRLAELSEIERNDFILRMFINKERMEAGKRRHISDPDEREEMLYTAKIDMGGVAGDLDDPQSNWFGTVRKALESAGISTDGADNALVRELAEKLQRAEVEATFRTMQALNGHPHKSRDPFFSNIHADSPLPNAAKQSKTIGDLCADYMAHNLHNATKGSLAPSIIPKIKMRCRILTDLFGEGMALASLSSEDAARLVDFLPTLPQNATKRYKGVSLVTAAERESKLPAKRLIHPETADDYLTGISAMLSHGMERGWLKANPLKGRLVRERMPRLIRRERLTLTPDEMTKVFSSKVFLTQRHGGRNALEARYWVPLLCLFHGTRSNEVAGMHAADVEEAAGIAFLNLREHAEHRLKNETSARRVPVHGKLIELGFLEFVARRREEEPVGYLFSGLSRNRNGSMADGIGKWWQRLVTGLLGAAPANGAIGARGIHSLRHSWVAATRAAGLDDSTRKRLGGWSQADASEGYGWSGALPMLKKAIDKIAFPGVEFL